MHRARDVNRRLTQVFSITPSVVLSHPEVRPGFLAALSSVLCYMKLTGMWCSRCSPPLRQRALGSPIGRKTNSRFLALVVVRFSGRIRLSFLSALGCFAVLLFLLFIYRLCWVFDAGCQLSLVAVNGAALHCGAEAVASVLVVVLTAEHGPLAHGLSNCSTQA